jgi:hypothetical protein
MDIVFGQQSAPYWQRPWMRLSVTYKINILANVDDDLEWLRKNDRTSYVNATLLSSTSVTLP